MHGVHVPPLNWFLSEREASLSTDTQSCPPHPSTASHANYSSICSPSLFHTSYPFTSPPFFAFRLILPSFFSSFCQTYSAISGWSWTSLLNLVLISLHCNGDMPVVFYCQTKALRLTFSPVGLCLQVCRKCLPIKDFISITYYLFINWAVCKRPNWGKKKE